jgi:hypothetical protein
MASKPIRPIRVEGNIAYVPLTQGYVAVIDAADVPLVEAWNWHALVGSHTVYACRTDLSTGVRIAVLMHRSLIGAISQYVDHRDGDGLNNRRKNLREATGAENQSNARRRADNTSGAKGVGWHKDRRKWQARIVANRVEHHLGYFDTVADAAEAYAAASTKMHGAFGRIS